MSCALTGVVRIHVAILGSKRMFWECSPGVLRSRYSKNVDDALRPAIVLKCEAIAQLQPPNAVTLEPKVVYGDDPSVQCLRNLPFFMVLKSIIAYSALRHGLEISCTPAGEVKSNVSDDYPLQGWSIVAAWDQLLALLFAKTNADFLPLDVTQEFILTNVTDGIATQLTSRLSEVGESFLSMKLKKSAEA